MKPNLRAASIAALVAALPTTSAASVTTFDLVVPQRSGMAAIQDVRITLVLDDMTSSFTIGLERDDGETASTGSLSPGSESTIVTIGSGSSADFARVYYSGDSTSSEPTLHSRYELVISMTNTDSFCLSTLGADETWTISITGGPELLGACPLSIGSSTTGSCGTDVVFDADVATISGFPDPEVPCGEARPAVDVALVLDKSGSMGGFVDGSATVTKLAAMKDSVVDFLLFWKELRALEDLVYTGGIDLSGAPDDQVAIVLFDATAHWLSNGTSDIVGLQAFDGIEAAFGTTSGLDHFVQNEITDGGTTSIGAGMDLAIGEALFVDKDTSDNGHRKAMLVMSNGKQNAYPLVETSSASSVETEASSGAGASVIDHQDDLTIYTVTVGSSAVTGPAVNKEMATRTGGFYLSTEDDATAMRPYFLELLQNFVRFSTYETTRLASGSIGDGEPYTLELPVTSTTAAAALQVMWTRGQGTVRLQATSPSGTIVSDTSREGRVILPLPRPEPGEWEVLIDADGVSGETGALKFDFIAVAEDQALRSDLGVVPSDYRVGDSIRLEADVRYLGRDLLNLGSGTGDTMVVRVLQPEASLGDLLSESTASSEQDPQDAADPASAADAKLHNELMENADGVGHSDDDLMLRDDGDAAHGDLVAGDGIYSAILPTTFAGNYHFLFGLEGDSEGANRFSRMKYESTYVRAVPDEDATETTSNLDGNTLVVTFTPKTVFGHRLGPGWKNTFAFTTDDGQIVRPEDLIDGRYRAVLQAPGGTPPKVSLSFLDRPASVPDDRPVGAEPWVGDPGSVLIDDVLDRPDPPQSFWENIPWWVWLILLIVIVIIVVIRRSQQP